MPSEPGWHINWRIVAVNGLHQGRSMLRQVYSYIIKAPAKRLELQARSSLSRVSIKSLYTRIKPLVMVTTRQQNCSRVAQVSPRASKPHEQYPPFGDLFVVTTWHPDLMYDPRNRLQSHVCRDTNLLPVAYTNSFLKPQGSALSQFLLLFPWAIYPLHLIARIPLHDLSTLNCFLIQATARHTRRTISAKLANLSIFIHKLISFFFNRYWP